MPKHPGRKAAARAPIFGALRGPLMTLHWLEYWRRSKNVVLGLLSVWIGLFFLTSTYMKPLNKMLVPGLDLPLGFYMPMQAAVVVFAIMLFQFARATR